MLGRGRAVFEQRWQRRAAGRPGRCVGRSFGLEATIDKALLIKCGSVVSFPWCVSHEVGTRVRSALEWAGGLHVDSQQVKIEG